MNARQPVGDRDDAVQPVRNMRVDRLEWLLGHGVIHPAQHSAGRKLQRDRELASIGGYALPAFGRVESISLARGVRARLMRPYGPPLPTRHWPVWLRYLATILLFGLVLLLQSVWREAAQYPFLFFFSSVIFSAVLFNRGAWILAT